MGFLQNYLGLEPAYKDGHDLPQPGYGARGFPALPHTGIGYGHPGFGRERAVGL